MGGLRRRETFLTSARDSAFSADTLGARETRAPAADRFKAVRGKADIKWRTEDLMALLRD